MGNAEHRLGDGNRVTDSALAKIATALDAYPDPQHPHRRGAPTLPAVMAVELIAARARIAELEAKLGAGASDAPRTLHQALELAERAYWSDLMPRYGGDVIKAAPFAGVNRSTVYKRLGMLGLELVRASKHGRRPMIREPRSIHPTDLRLRRPGDPKIPKVSERRP